MRGAFHQRNVILVRIDELGQLRPGLPAHFVQIKVMLGGRSRWAIRGHVKEAAQFFNRTLRHQAYTGRVEKGLPLQRGKFLANLVQCH
jgi:hypothetical protein